MQATQWREVAEVSQSLFLTALVVLSNLEAQQKEDDDIPRCDV